MLESGLRGRFSVLGGFWGRGIRISWFRLSKVDLKGRIRTSLKVEFDLLVLRSTFYISWFSRYSVLGGFWGRGIRISWFRMPKVDIRGRIRPSTFKVDFYIWVRFSSHSVLGFLGTGYANFEANFLARLKMRQHFKTIYYKGKILINYNILIHSHRACLCRVIRGQNITHVKTSPLSKSHPRQNNTRQNITLVIN